MNNMFLNGILLIEIGVQELPINKLIFLRLMFSKYIKYEFNKFNFFYKNERFYITSRRFSCLLYDFYFYQKFKFDYKIINGPKLFIDNCDNFFKDKKILGWANKYNIKKSDILFKIENNFKCFFFKKKNESLGIDLLIKNIINNVLIKLNSNYCGVRWSKKNFLFLKPITNIIVMFNKKILDFCIFGVRSGNKLLCNRFLLNKNILLYNSKDYIDFLLNYGKVILICKDRVKKIIYFLKKISFFKKIFFKFNISFFRKIVFMYEWPVLLLCKFKKKFLFLPKEFIIYILEKHYFFVSYNLFNNLNNYFIVVLNIEIVNYIFLKNNYENIINSELNELKKLYIKDIKYDLIFYLYKLRKLFFHRNLGTYFDKIRRILYMCKYILKKTDLNINYILLNKAILLSKCDLATCVYKEYPLLKGIIGMHYSYLSNNEKKISYIIKNHYFNKKNIDHNNIYYKYSILISLVDNIDTFVGIFILKNNLFFFKKQNDPYGLKKISDKIINLILLNKIYLNILFLIKYSLLLYRNFVFVSKYFSIIINFLIKRCFVFFLKYGHHKNDIMSILKINNFDIFDFKNKLIFIKKNKYKNIFIKLVCVFKRINNILLKFNFDKKIILNKYFFFNFYEINVYNYLIFIKNKINKFLILHNYNLFFRCLYGSLKKIEIFLDKVKINVKNVYIKNNRYWLLNQYKIIFKKFSNFLYYF